jgi:hypothetical protein
MANEEAAARPQHSITNLLSMRNCDPPTYSALLAPKSINPARDNAVEVTEFRIAGKTYIRCKDLTMGARRGLACTAHYWK